MPPGLMAPGEEDLDEDFDDDEEEAEGLLASLVLDRPHHEHGQRRWFVAPLLILKFSVIFWGNLAMFVRILKQDDSFSI